jgi:TolB-like protein
MLRTAFLPLALLLAAAPSQAEGETRLLMMDLTTTGVQDETAALVGELISVELSKFSDLEVFSGADVKRMVELEADKAAAGCEDTSCLADIAGALGARYVIYGRMGKLGSRYIITLNLFDAEEAKAIARRDIKSADLDEVSDKLNATVDELVRPLVGNAAVDEKLPPPKPVEEPPPVVREPPPPPKKDSALPDILIGAGVITGVVGLLYDAFADESYNNELDASDAVGPVAYAAAAGLILGGMALEE